MNELDRFFNIFCAYMFSEEDRLSYNCYVTFKLLQVNEFDSYYILKHLEAVRKYQDFQIFCNQVLELFRGFG